MTDSELAHELEALVSRALPTGMRLVSLSDVTPYPDGSGDAIVQTRIGNGAPQRRELRFRHGPNAVRLHALSGFEEVRDDVPTPRPYDGAVAEYRAAQATAPKSELERWHEQWRARRLAEFEKEWAR